MYTFIVFLCWKYKIYCKGLDIMYLSKRWLKTTNDKNNSRENIVSDYYGENGSLIHLKYQVLFGILLKYDVLFDILLKYYLIPRYEWVFWRNTIFNMEQCLCFENLDVILIMSKHWIKTQYSLSDDLYKYLYFYSYLGMVLTRPIELC